MKNYPTDFTLDKSMQQKLSEFIDCSDYVDPRIAESLRTTFGEV